MSLSLLAYSFVYVCLYTSQVEHSCFYFLHIIIIIASFEYIISRFRLNTFYFQKVQIGEYSLLGGELDIHLFYLRLYIFCKNSDFNSVSITMENITEIETKLVLAVDTSFLLLTGMNILIMQAGFTALEVGGSRAKHVKSLLFKNFMDHAVGSLSWFTIGWGLFIGSNPFVSGPDATFFIHPIEQYARLFQQFAFAATAATIVSGAVTGRCRLEPYVVLSAFLAGISYPITAHWAWSDFGWLKTLGFLDFAGSCVVHAFGGSVALVCAWACGPRPGRFVIKSSSKQNSNTVNNTDTMILHPSTRVIEEVAAHGEAENASTETGSLPSRCPRGLNCTSRPKQLRVYEIRAVPKGSNPPLMVLGSLLLYVAWFSFNAGSSGTIYGSPDSSVRAAVNTMLAAGAASVASMIITLVVGVKYDIEMACNCMLSGLVAITAGCGYLDPWAAVVCGLNSITAIYCFSLVCTSNTWSR